METDEFLNSPIAIILATMPTVISAAAAIFIFRVVGRTLASLRHASISFAATGRKHHNHCDHGITLCDLFGLPTFLGEAGAWSEKTFFPIRLGLAKN